MDIFYWKWLIIYNRKFIIKLCVCSLWVRGWKYTRPVMVTNVIFKYYFVTIRIHPFPDNLWVRHNLRRIIYMKNCSIVDVWRKINETSRKTPIRTCPELKCVARLCLILNHCAINIILFFFNNQGCGFAR